MGVLLERKTQVIFVTASSVEQNGKAREVIVESRPLYAVVQLNGSKEKYPVAWEMIYSLQKSGTQRTSGWRLHPRANVDGFATRIFGIEGVRYLFLGDFFAARFGGFAEEVVAGTTSPAFFLAQRAPTILRAWALRSSGVSFAQRALPPSDWIVLRCSQTVKIFLKHFHNRRQGMSQI